MPSTRVEAAHEAIVRAKDDDAWERIKRLIEHIVTLRSRKTVSYELDVQPTQLSDALNPATGKQLQMRWLPTLARLCPPELRSEFRDALLALVDDEDPLDPEEELEQLKSDVLSELGHYGAQLVERAKRRRTRKSGR